MYKGKKKARLLDIYPVGEPSVSQIGTRAVIDYGVYGLSH